MFPILPLQFTSAEAFCFAQNGCLEEWVHLFLKTSGRNIPFSEGLKLQKRHWLGPVWLPLEELERCCGPEEHMKYYNPPEGWERRVGKLSGLLQQGWDYPPLIAEHLDGKLIINDGNGRHEAMKRLGREHCWVILWDSSGGLNRTES